MSKYFWSEKQIKINTMETYSLLQKPNAFMNFWRNYCDENHHIERIPVAAKDIDHLFRLASEIIKAVNLHLFLLSNGSRIDDNEYLSSLENGTELIVCTEEQIQKLLIYFELKRYLSFKSISYPLDILYNAWLLFNFDINWSDYKQFMCSLVQSIFLIVLHMTLNKWKSSKRVRSR